MNKIDVLIDKLLFFLFDGISPSKRDLIKQIIKFCFVGASNTLVSYIVYIIIIFALKPCSITFDYIIGNIFSFIISVFWSFCLNNKFVFTLKEGQKRNPFLVLIKTYVSYAFTGLLLTNILSFIWISVLGLPKEIAPIINLFICVPLNFIINKFWAYKINKENESK